MHHQQDLSKVPTEKIEVVAVCGSEARVYGDIRGNQPRRLLQVVRFGNRGQALNFADEYETREKLAYLRRIGSPFNA